MNPARHHNHRRPDGPGSHWLGRVILVALLARLATVSGTAAENVLPSTTTAAGLATVLEIPRLPDQDLVFLRRGERVTGRVLNDVFQLRMATGELTLPARLVAGIDLTDDRHGLAVIATVNANRFSGFLSERIQVLPAGDSDAPTELRPEMVLKLVFRRRPDELKGLPGGLRVRLRNGDFFTGTPADDRFHADDTGKELRWVEDGIVSATFPHSGEDTARLIFKDGRELMGRWMAEAPVFQLDLGAPLSVHPGRIQAMTAPGPLPPDLMRRIGAEDTVVRLEETGAAPDPAVVPIPGMVWIPPGDFTQGSPIEEKDRDLDEGPTTRVIIPDGFWIGRHEVTQVEYETLTGTNPSRYVGDGQHPVERVNWQEAMAYCRRLTQHERAAGQLPEGYEYRLPTEAEWEYACRAGTTTRFHFGDDPGYALVTDHAWVNQNSDSATHPVGTKKANPWGLHDLHGNVCEWCLDPWQGNLPGGTVTNRFENLESSLRVARGGSWLYEARFARAANRDSYGALNRCSDVGFRLVLSRRPGEAAGSPPLPLPSGPTAPPRDE